MIINSRCQKETVELGKKLGSLLEKECVIAFFGGLGVGKTAFVSGIVNGLGYDDYISSPTFTIVNEYNTNPYVFHFDLYRVNDPDELDNIGFDEYFQKEGIVIIEWAEYIEKLLPEEYLKIIISNNYNNADLRKIELIPYGDIYKHLIDKFHKKLGGPV